MAWFFGLPFVITVCVAGIDCRRLGISPQLINVSSPHRLFSDFPQYRDATLSARAKSYWDSDGIVDEAMWQKYVAKGQHLKCVMEARTRVRVGSSWTLGRHHQ
jgi:hypothetical protein